MSIALKEAARVASSPQRGPLGRSNVPRTRNLPIARSADWSNTAAKTNRPPRSALLFDWAFPCVSAVENCSSRWVAARMPHAGALRQAPRSVDESIDCHSI
jgi:hypothetical protein